MIQYTVGCVRDKSAKRYIYYGTQGRHSDVIQEELHTQQLKTADDHHDVQITSTTLHCVHECYGTSTNWQLALDPKPTTRESGENTSSLLLILHWWDTNQATTNRYTDRSDST